MQLEDFKYFNELYIKKSFTKVAQYYGVSQPSISSALKRLENFFGMKLVIRGTAQSQLTFTPAGEQLYQHAIALLTEVSSAQHELNHLKTHMTTIGLPPILKGAYFAKIAVATKQFDQQFNINNMSIYESGSNNLKKALIDGDIDIALLGSLNQSQEKDLLIMPFIQSNFCVYISKKNDLAQKKEIFFSELKEQQFVSLDSSFIHNQAIREMSSQAGFRPNYFMKTNDINFLMNLVGENLGVAILTNIVKPTSSDIIVLPLLDKVQPSFIGSVAFRKNHVLTKEEEMLVETLSQET
ncbi:LysR family transcriptional regulator [Leuconostoc litchii]|uniref:LysR family transcriptional regulator n=1 Tax=Leuconostoc litchii TaxID=1981069 RepID=A0A6P2CNY5_9LACO|nr:LysR family transcriptional regulator [Leuconostoc litchii]TYC47093.1 LysR family transcriptional regulator [Leuconostoc litchii]GMA69035.1 LysR family transcriptional regulator [Leuconostoc litchii]